MKKFIVGVILLVAVVWMFASATSLPTVQVGDKDQCVRVIAIEHGQEVERSCNTINLQADRYHMERVYGNDAEVAALKAEMAEQEALRLAHQ